MTPLDRGRLVALEGIDGCGKSTQAAILAGRLGALLTFEPGATPLGASLRRLLLESDRAPVAVRSEALLMAADRAQHVSDILVPALDAGRWVVTDRYSGSTLAYQGYGRGIDRSELTLLVEWATGGLRPDVTVLIDVPVATAGDRRGAKAADRFEGQPGGFLQRVSDGFRALAGEEDPQWVVVDGSGTVEETAEAVWTGVTSVIGLPPGGVGGGHD